MCAPSRAVAVMCTPLPSKISMRDFANEKFPSPISRVFWLGLVMNICAVWAGPDGFFFCFALCARAGDVDSHCLVQNPSYAHGRFQHGYRRRIKFHKERILH